MCYSLSLESWKRRNGIFLGLAPELNNGQRALDQCITKFAEDAQLRTMLINFASFGSQNYGTAMVRISLRLKYDTAGTQNLRRLSFQVAHAFGQC